MFCAKHACLSLNKIWSHLVTFWIHMSEFTPKTIVLLMDEILHLGCINLANNRITHILIGAGVFFHLSINLSVSLASPPSPKHLRAKALSVIPDEIPVTMKSTMPADPGEVYATTRWAQKPIVYG